MSLAGVLDPDFRAVPRERTGDVPLLVTSIFFVSFCALLYQLLMGTLASYLLGNSVFHFSITTGLFMFFMGVGSYLSRFICKDLIRWFVVIEILLGIVGGFSAFVLYQSFGITGGIYPAHFFLIGMISTLVGLEIPLVTRIVREFRPLKDALSQILAFDYLGGLIGAVLFPLILLPYLGTIQTAFCVGVLNLAIGGITWLQFREQVRLNVIFPLTISLGLVALIIGTFSSEQILKLLDSAFYDDEIILSKQSAYQKIVVTKFRDDTRLYLNGDLQFSSLDEYRYHEPLVHLAMLNSKYRNSVLVLGGGDGLVAREILKHNEVESVTIVDLDPEVTKIASTHPIFTKLNEGSLSSEKVRVINEDAFSFIDRVTELFNVVIIDLPDPNDLSLGKLYSREFYSMLSKRIAKGGVIVTQATSPYFSRESFWCIVSTLETAFKNVLPYQSYVPSFGSWGYVMASDDSIGMPSRDQFEGVPLRWLTYDVALGLARFEKDTARNTTELNSIDTQNLVRLYEASVDSTKGN